MFWTRRAGMTRLDRLGDGRPRLSPGEMHITPHITKLQHYAKLNCNKTPTVRLITPLALLLPPPPPNTQHLVKAKETWKKRASATSAVHHAAVWKSPGLPEPTEPPPISGQLINTEHLTGRHKHAPPAPPALNLLVCLHVTGPRLRLGFTRKSHWGHTSHRKSEVEGVPNQGSRCRCNVKSFEELLFINK